MSKISKAAKRCVTAMSQGDKPTQKQFLAAWRDGLIDTTPLGEIIIKEEVYPKPTGVAQPRLREASNDV